MSFIRHHNHRGIYLSYSTSKMARARVSDSGEHLCAVPRILMKSFSSDVYLDHSSQYLAVVGLDHRSEIFTGVVGVIREYLQGVN